MFTKKPRPAQVHRRKCRAPGGISCKIVNPNFAECPKGEVRRILIPRTSANKGRSCSPVQPQFPLRVQIIVDSSVVGYHGARNVRDEDEY
jgi:hypothetical protein